MWSAKAGAASAPADGEGCGGDASVRNSLHVSEVFTPTPTLPLRAEGVTRRVLVAATVGVALTSQAAEIAVGITPRALTFPTDHGAHPDTRTEWWYVTGSLQSGSDNFGFQITFFRSKTNVAADHPSRFAASQLHFAHVALIDLQAKKMQHDQRIARGGAGSGFGRASAAQGDTNLMLGGWTLKRIADVNLPTYESKINTANFAFDLTLTATQPLLLQGDAGYSRKGPSPASASWYYTLPHLAVTGTIGTGRDIVRVTGSAWKPSPSGPRWLIDAVMRRSTAMSAGPPSGRKIPVMPHIRPIHPSSALQSRHSQIDAAAT